jgi:hypothetical protein
MNNLKYLISIFFLVNSTLFAGIGGLGGGAINYMEKNEWRKVEKLVKHNKKLELSGTTTFIGKIVSVFEVCLTPENVRTTRKVPVYKRKYVGKSRDHDNQKDGYTEVVVGKEFQNYPRNKKTTIRKCDHKGKKCKHSQITKIYDPVATIRLKSKRFSTQSRFREIHQKDYQIPDCE